MFTAPNESNYNYEGYLNAFNESILSTKKEKTECSFRCPDDEYYSTLESIKEGLLPTDDEIRDAINEAPTVLFDYDYREFNAGYSKIVEHYYKNTEIDEFKIVEALSEKANFQIYLGGYIKCSHHKHPFLMQESKSSKEKRESNLVEAQKIGSKLTKKDIQGLNGMQVYEKLSNEFSNLYKAPLSVLRKTHHRFYFLRSFYNKRLYDKEKIKACESKLTRSYRLHKYEYIKEHVVRELITLLAIGVHDEAINNHATIVNYMYVNQHNYIDNRLYIPLNWFKRIFKAVISDNETSKKIAGLIIEKYGFPRKDVFYTKKKWMTMQTKRGHNIVH